MQLWRSLPLSLLPLSLLLPLAWHLGKTLSFVKCFFVSVIFFCWLVVECFRLHLRPRRIIIITRLQQPHAVQLIAAMKIHHHHHHHHLCNLLSHAQSLMFHRWASFGIALGLTHLLADGSKSIS